MKQHAYKNLTFSLPVEISKDLHVFVKKGELSHFVANAIHKKLEARKMDLRNAYLAANKDPGQNEAAVEWTGRGL